MEIKITGDIRKALELMETIGDNIIQYVQEQVYKISNELGDCVDLSPEINVNSDNFHCEIEVYLNGGKIGFFTLDEDMEISHTEPYVYNDLDDTCHYYEIIKIIKDLLEKDSLD